MEKQWTTVITPKRKWYDFNFKELIQYKDLVFMFVKRSFTSQYKQTVLGPLWFIINPLITSFISTIVFGSIAGIESDGVPYFLFYMCGYILWNYFSTCVSATSGTFTANAGIMGKVYFPRISMPISSVIFSAVNMLVVFVMTAITMIVYNILGTSVAPRWEAIVLVPVLMIQTALLGLGVGIIISSLTTKYRDLAILVGFGLSLWMYATPIVYPMSKVSGLLRTLILINPMSAVVNNFKYAMLGIGEFELTYWLISIGVTIVLLMGGILLFNKVEKTFMDTV